MYPGVKKTSHGYRMACPQGHTDLIIRRIPGAHPTIAPQIYCPHCHNPDGSMQPVCSIPQLEEFAEIYSHSDCALYKEMLHDMRSHFGLES